jgi:dihydrofolate reductase
MISIIVAVSDDWGIGKDNELLWNIPSDLKRFKRLTLGNTLIMGKRTWESLPVRPLKGRKNIVLTDVPAECIDCSVTAYSIDDALGKCSLEEEIFIIGGGSIYRQFMPLADRLYITHIHKSAPADTFFPVIDKNESEFFGHKKGSFTGAITDKKGFFEISNQGTLFLDEIADMPMNLQAKMLRAIEEKSITRVGETHPVATDFRIISATNHDLDKLEEEKRFRLDLIHRLNTLHIHIPPLRERTEDIEPLLLFYVDDLSRKLNKPTPMIDKDVIPALREYRFPGNVRELKNMTERAIILSKGNSLGVRDFPVKVKLKSQQPAEPPKLNLDENEAMLIRTALQNNNNNQIAAANALGIQRMALARKIQKYNINITK